jgi:putative ABC transport system permease protein
MSRVLWLSSIRHLLRHPWQLGLSILGIALGVAVVVSIDLANESAIRAFTLSTETITGRATHQIVGGPTGLPEGVYTNLRLDPAIRPTAPVVEGEVGATDHAGRILHVLGIDLFVDEPFRPYLRGSGSGGRGDFAALLSEPATALLMAQRTASELGLELGDRLAVRVGSTPKELRVVGLLQPENDASARALDSLVLVDIATAQELLGLEGRLTRVDLIVPADAAGDALLARIEALVPPGGQVVRSEARTQALEQMTRAFRFNLSGAQPAGAGGGQRS